MVSDAGGKKGFVYRDRQAVYLKLVAKGMSQKEAASIANKGESKSGRKQMAHKAARTRKLKGGH